MPATLPTHPAAVLPLKVRYPHRFDGVALVAGTVTPDTLYGVHFWGIAPPTHSWHGLFWFNLPAAFALAAVLRWGAPFVAVHLPHGGPLALRDYGVLGTVRHPLRVTAYSAVLGALTHDVWDAFTHPQILITGSVLASPLVAVGPGGLPWWRLLQVISEVAGTIVTVLAFVHIGRRRLLRHWHGPPPATPRQPKLFWTVATVSSLTLLATVAVLPGNSAGPHVVVIRILCALTLAALAAGASAAFTGRRATTADRPTELARD